MNLDELKNKLVRGEYSSLTISWNDHACNYASVERFFTEWGEGNDYNWVSEEEKQKAIANNSLWHAQWYPDTPVGSYSVYASTFEALYKHLQENDFR